MNFEYREYRRSELVRTVALTGSDPVLDLRLSTYKANRQLKQQISLPKSFRPFRAGLSPYLGFGLRRQRRAQVTLAGRAGHGHDHLAPVFRALGDFNRRPDIRAG